MKKTQKLDRRKFIYASLGGAIAVLGGATAYFAMKAITPKAERIVFWYGGPWVPTEKAVVLELVRKFEEKTGYKVDLLFTPHIELYPKFVSAIDARQGPDLIFTHQPFATLYAYRGALVDISDVLDPVKKDVYPILLESIKQYNNVEGKYGNYSIPLGWATNFCHVRTDLIEKAGYDWKTISDLKWDEFWEVFKKAQQVTGVKAIGLSMASTAGWGDAHYNIDTFIPFFGGRIFTPERKLNLDDPATRKAMIEAVKFEAELYLGGWTPEGVTTWSDADNNIAFQTGKCVMTLNPTMSIPTWLSSNRIDLYREMTATVPLPKGPTGLRPSFIEFRNFGVIDPKFSANKNPEGAKKLMAFLLTDMNNYKEYITGHPMFMPNYKQFAEMKGLRYTDPADRHYPNALKYLTPDSYPYEITVVPQYAAVYLENVWGGMMGKVLTDKWAIERAVDWAIERAKTLVKEFKG